MERETKIQIISRNTIKPSTPTSHQRREFKLSLLEKTYPSIYGSMIFFYTSSTKINGHSSIFLQNSLAKTLVHFYPFAGRLKGDDLVYCDDEGAYFLEAQTASQLCDFLGKPDPKLLNQLLPFKDPKTSNLATNVVLLVQLTFFSCGGVAISACASQKVADSISLCSFVQTWSAITCEENFLPPNFVGASLFPPGDLPLTLGFEGKNWTTKRLVFDASKLSNLKEKTAKVLKDSPSNFDLVSAILFKCAINAASKSKSRGLRPSVIYQLVNLREKMVTTFPENNTVGNRVWLFPMLVEESRVGLFELLAKMRKGMANFCNDEANCFEGDDSFSLVSEILRNKEEMLEMGINMYSCTSLSNFPLYEMEFGWGKPIWVTCPMEFPNLFVLTDAKWGQGIEAWVSLEEQQMDLFERQEEILELASFNPNVTSTYCRM
ncbi:hypothetical protein UlMin_006387 [Ulmus minor]